MFKQHAWHVLRGFIPVCVPGASQEVGARCEVVGPIGMQGLVEGLGRPPMLMEGAQKELETHRRRSRPSYATWGSREFQVGDSS